LQVVGLTEENEMNLKFKLALIRIVFSVFALVASRTAYAAPPTDACSLLTVAQVRAVLGVQVAADTPDPKKLCSWHAPGAPGSKQAGVTLWNPGAFPSADRALPGFVIIPVKGIGDDAAYTGAKGSGYEGGYKLFVKKGGVVFSVTVLGFPVDETKEKEKTLALNVLAKL
jgi:hypothetical protein